MGDNSVCMKIILVATGVKGKNVVFVSDTLHAYPLDEAVRLAKEGKFENVYAVKGRNSPYLRTRRDTPTNEQLEKLSVSARQLFAFTNDTRSAASTPPLARYLNLYEHTLQKDGGPFIVIDEKVKITKEAARIRLQPHQELIFSAAKKFKVDPYLLAAIIIDEIARFGVIEHITDPLFGYFIGLNASAGVAQVKIDTARGLVQTGYYNPDPNNPKLSPEKVGKMPRLDLYEYVKQPRHSIFFAAARIRELADRWKSFVDLNTMPEVVATLYHLSDEKKKPHGDPKSNERGLQIVQEFYKLAKEWLQ